MIGRARHGLAALGATTRSLGRRGRLLLSSGSLLGLAWACAGAPSPSVASPGGAPLEAADPSWRSQRPPPAEPRGFHYPAARVSRLPNGVQLWLVPRPAGTVALSVNVLAGGAHSPAGKSGLAALTLRSMTEATRLKSGLALAEAAEDLGTSIDFDTGRDGSSISLEVLPSDVDAGLALLSEIVTQPRFAAEDVQRIQRQWLDSLRGERQDPGRLSSLAGMRALLGTVAGAPVRGSVPDVERLRREDLVRFHQQHYVAGNLAVIAVGDLSMDRFQELAQAGFGQMPPRSAPPLPALELPAPLPETTVWIIDRADSVQSALFVGQRFPERAAPGYEARQVMNNLLGGLFTSRLNLNLREQHAYTYGVRSLAIATRRFGAFLAMSNVKTEATADALQQLTAELSGIATGNAPIQDEELARAKTDLIHQLGGNLEHVRRIWADTAELFVDALPPDYHSTYRELILRVDRQAAAREAARLTPQQLAVIIVGDQQKITPLLAAKGITPLTAPPEFSQ